MARKRRSALEKLGFRAAIVLKEFASMSSDNEDAKQEFMNELLFSENNEIEAVKDLLEYVLENSNIRRLEKSINKSNATTNVDNRNGKKITKKEMIIQSILEHPGVHTKKSLEYEFQCDRKTVERALHELPHKYNDAGFICDELKASVT